MRLRTIVLSATVLLAVGGGAATALASSNTTGPGTPFAQQKEAAVAAQRSRDLSAAAQVARSTVPPTTTPISAEVPTPAAPGIVPSAHQSPEPGVFAEVNEWLGYVGTQFTIVGAGDLMQSGQPSTVGAVVVAVPGETLPKVLGTYTCPSISGPFAITAASADILTLTGTNGQCSFDAATDAMTLESST